jgi:hypothetical protein
MIVDSIQGSRRKNREIESTPAVRDRLLPRTDRPDFVPNAPMPERHEYLDREYRLHAGNADAQRSREFHDYYGNRDYHGNRD